MVPKRLKEAREAAGYSQEKLAQLVDIETVNARSRISNYESGRFAPSFEFVSKVADLLHYPVGYFYTADDTFAEMMLNLYRNEEFTNNQAIRLKLEEAKMLVQQLNKCLK
ncbi:helix-turn-helix transcriptional regulator [Escherichia coli]|nr:helix-turn-helix transcriptional regulator [Escherichia coli]